MNFKATYRVIVRGIKLVIFNLLLILLNLNIFGFFLTKYYFKILKSRYESQIIEENIFFSNIFRDVQLAFRPLPQYFSIYDTVTFYWNAPGTYNMAIFDENYVAFNNDAGLRVQRNKEFPNNFSIAILGDSHAYGIGVENHETYASILSQKGYAISLVACSSFGTAREFLKTEQLIENGIIDTPDILVIHYCPNDFEENTSFVSRNFSLKRKSEELFIENYRFNSRQATFTQVYERLPTLLSMPLLAKGISNKINNLGNSWTFTYFKRPQETIKPLNTISNSENDLYNIVNHFLRKPGFDNVKSVHFLLAASPKFYTYELIEKHKALIEESVKKLRFQFEDKSFSEIYLPEENNEKYYFKVDDHTNTIGHQWYAEELEKRLFIDE